MTRRGQCRCGTILQFQMTKQGYKTRCPDCSAVVRLRDEDPAKAAAASPKKQKKKAASPVTSAPQGPPPLPPPLPPMPPVPDSEQTDFATDGLPDEEADVGAPGENPTAAPLASPELMAFEPEEKPASAVQWWLLAALAALVVVGVGAAAMFFG